MARTHDPESENIWSEMCVLSSKSKRDERLAKWLDHVNTFAKIKYPDGKYNEGRLLFAAAHLDVLDPKFGFLLGFQGLLATIIALTVNALSLDRIAHSPRWEFLVVRALLSVGLLLWLGNTLLCLSGVRRVVWGDMWRYKDDPDPKSAEQDHLKSLLTAVVKRTAKFRIAVRALLCSVFLVTVLAGAGAYASSTSTWPPPPPVEQHASCPCPQAPAPPEARYQLVDSMVHVKGRLSHSHTFLLDRETGDIWQMSCRKGTVVEFQHVERR